MTREEALEIVKAHKDWDISSTSFAYRTGNVKTLEDSIYDERRKAVLQAFELLNSSDKKK